MASSSLRFAFLGATQGIGRALARQLAARGDQLCLLGRKLDDLERSAADLEARGVDGKVLVASCDLERPETFGPALDAATEALGGLDGVIITAGMFATQDQLEDDLELTARLLEVDFTHTVLFCEQARRRLLPAGGTLCVISSVAGDRGRKPTAIYGAAKAGLQSYLEAMDHKFRGQGLVTIDVRPGFIKTGMTAGLKPPPFSGEPEEVARRVVRAIDRAEPKVYTPFMWRWVMLVIRWLPRAVMRRIGF